MPLHPFLPQKKLFKAYDIRGDRQLFTDDFLQALAFGFAKLFTYHRAGEVVIGYDVRLDSERIAQFLAVACQNMGLKVIWLGQVTTPIMAYIAHEHSGNGLMVTASHSEKHINGIKWLICGESPSQTDIEDLFFALADQSPSLPNDHFYQQLSQFSHQVSAQFTADNRYFSHYQTAIHTALEQIAYRNPSVISSVLCTKKRLVIDCLNGATSRFAEPLFTSLGYDCVMLNDLPDGNFPKGNPDPTEAHRLAELCQAVKDHHADMGLAFDGDGDRLMVVTEQGEVVSPDHLLYLLAKIALSELPDKTLPNPEVIFDVKCSHHLPRLIAEQGALPVMEKTGSSLMRKSLQNQSRCSIFAGELSGHFLFNDGYFVLHDDAMYAGVRLLNWLAKQPESLGEMLAKLPVSVSTADMYLPIESSEVGKTLITRLVKVSKKPFNALKRAFSLNTINTTDGLRLDFAHGFGILRKSNTGNFLTVRFAGDSLDDLQQVQKVFVSLCRSIDADLAKQVAQIQPV